VVHGGGVDVAQRAEEEVQDRLVGEDRDQGGGG